ncbi:Hypothetical predicted protein [Paramuricea clavata]|uniref:Uncharacterized protein n=1 Tax=Paramuricea clavata TaxID=317549 RepID=A0A6S7INJ5_PARCT|nr:Hypothetical predicted protein [Paramuricea clavata]
MFHSLGTESVVPAIENNRGKPTQNNQYVRKAPSLGNHTATNRAEICFLSSDNQSQKWTKPEVQQLLILYKAHEEKFHDPKWKKISIWKEIAKEMNQHGYSYSDHKCQVKFKNLKQTYVKTVDHNSKSGNSFKTCSFFDELNEIFACNPSVVPVAECSNRKGYKVVDKEAPDKEGTSEENSHSPIDKGIAIKDGDLKKGKPAKRRFSVTESLISIQDEMKKENEKRMEKMEEMHKEKMQRFDHLLNLYERDLSNNADK